MEQHVPLSHISMIVGKQAPDHRNNLVHRFRDTRLDRRLKAAQSQRVFLIDFSCTFGQISNGNATLRRARNDLVFHVSDVAQIGDVVLAIVVTQQTKQHVENNHGASIANMSEVIDRRSADIHANVLRIDRQEDLLLARCGVVNRKSHYRYP